MLLTMSAATGIDQLHRDFPADLRESRKVRTTNRKASVIGSVLADLEKHGASSWRENNVECFLIYLITEIGVAPQNSVGGRSAMSLLSTLQSTVIDLVSIFYIAAITTADPAFRNDCDMGDGSV
jgi:hypothetical protein